MEITSAAQQHRQSTGNHTAQQDAQQRSQVKQNQYTRDLADQPGLHSGNVNRQQAAATYLQFLTFLISIQNTTSRGVESPFFKEGHEDAPPEAGESTANAGGKPATPIMSAIKDVLVKAGDFIEQHDPLKFPGAEAGPVRKGGDVQMQYWQSRNITLPETVTNSDIKAPCRYVGEKIPFSDYLREFGQGLRYPATKISVNIQTMGYWYAKGRCPTQEEINDVAEVTLKIDAVGSMLVGLLPNSKPVVVMQNIVAPILTMIADDLDGKPTSREEQMNLVDQMTMMSRASVEQMTPEEQVAVGSESAPGAPRQKKYSIPEFHVKRGRTEVSLNLNGEMIRAPLTEVRGRFFVTLPRGTGPEGRQEVFFNHIHRRWDCSGGKGKFNRFSKNERRLAQKFGIDQHHVHDKTLGDPPYYAVRNPHVRYQPYIKAVEIYGRLVPCRKESGTGRHFIYDARNPEGRGHEVVFTNKEWHLKASPLKFPSATTLYSPEYGKMLEVAIVRVKNGKTVWAQFNPEAGYFVGPKFTRSKFGELEEITSNKGKPLKTRGGSDPDEVVRSQKTRGTKLSQAEEVKVPGASFSGKVMKRPVEGSPYIQYYATGGKTSTAETLVVSAHGGFINSDTMEPVVVMPSDVTIKMLTPHGTKLHDPGLEHFVSPNKDFRAYVTLNDGAVSDVNFVSQEGNEDWLFDEGFEPLDDSNTLGRKDGLQNYRHHRYEGESDEYIAKVLTDNHQLAETGKAPLSDVITVSDEISNMGDTDPKIASVQRLIDLDKEGKLLNEKGEHYKTIVFAHCRNNFLIPESSTSTYMMEPVAEGVEISKSKGASVDNIQLTTLHRESVEHPFEVKHFSVGEFQFTPMVAKTKGFATSTTLS
jgi:hypothetical protein